MHDEANAPRPLSTAGGADRLESWKEIATFLRRGVTTVQRWEEEEELPVHRLAHAKRGTVFAYKSEIEAWKVSRTRLRADVGLPRATEPAAVSRLANLRLPFIAAALTATVLATFAAAKAVGSADSDSGALFAAPVPLANDAAHEQTPSLSPDGRNVVYRWAQPGGEGLYVKQVTGGPPRRLEIGSIRSVSQPKWSPSGDTIAFLGGDIDGRRGVFLIPSHGDGVPRRLTSTSATGLCWAPDGRSLGVVDREAPDEPLAVYLVSLETGRRTTASKPPRGSFGDTQCAFSSDGRLAVSRFFTIYQADICVIGPTPDIATRLTYASEGIGGLAWTPDGLEIVFGTADGLWRVRAAGKSAPVRILARPGGGHAFPAFAKTSDAGVRLVFESRTFDVNLWSWHAGPGRGAFTKLGGSTDWEDHPSLAPDGKSIAFISNRAGKPAVWVASAAGNDARQVTFDPSSPASAPRWSPDGRQVAYESTSDGNHDIYVMRLDGSRPLRLTWDPSQEDNPSWSRDGRWVYFRSDRRGNPQFWRQRSDGAGVAEPVTEGEASQAFESADGHLLYFVRRMGRGGLWSVPVSGGVEKFVTPHVEEGYWAVADTAIVFIVKSPEVSREGPTLRSLNLRTGRVSTLAMLPSRADFIKSGFTVSRDAQVAVWSKIDRWDTDLLLIDHWR